MQDLSKHYQFLLDCYGFRVARVYDANMFDNLLVDLDGPLFRVRFTRERSYPEIWIAFLDDPNEFVLQYLWFIMIHGKRPEWADSPSVTFETITAALEQDMPALETLFHENEIESTREWMTLLLEEVSQQMRKRYGQ